MEKLTFDTGIKEYEVNGGEILRFNPSDPNVYRRFMEVYHQLEGFEKEYAEQIEPLKGESDEKGFDRSEKILSAMKEIDRKVKERLSYAFGEQNDFDKIMDGVNLMAVGSNGERVVTNLFAALTPIVESGIVRHDKKKADAAVAMATANRAQRRAKK